MVIINYNLPPKLRFKREFLHIVGLIPGDMNSFLWPLIEELNELEHELLFVTMVMNKLHLLSMLI
jgi:hypothetical protein